MIMPLLMIHAPCKVHTGRPHRRTRDQQLPVKLFYDVVLLNEMTGWSGHGEDVIGDPAEKHDGGGWNKMILLLLVRYNRV